MGGWVGGGALFRSCAPSGVVPVCAPLVFLTPQPTPPLCVVQPCSIFSDLFTPSVTNATGPVNVTFNGAVHFLVHPCRGGGHSVTVGLRLRPLCCCARFQLACEPKFPSCCHRGPGCLSSPPPPPSSPTLPNRPIPVPWYTFGWNNQGGASGPWPHTRYLTTVHSELWTVDLAELASPTGGPITASGLCESYLANPQAG